MRKKILRIICLALVVVMVAVCFTACAKKEDTAAQPTTFIAAFTHGEPVSQNWKKACEEIAARSDGAYELQLYWSGSLLPMPDVPAGVGTGQATFVNIPLNNFPDMFPLNARILALPFMGLEDPIISAEIAMQLIEEFPEMMEEFNVAGIMPMGLTTIGMYDMHFTDKNPVRLPEDMRGRQVIPYKLEFLSLLEANNAAGSYIPPGQVYEALEKGVANGYVNNWAFQGWFGLTDLIKQHVQFGEFGAFHEHNLLAVNLDFYNAQSEDLQKMIKDVLWNEGGYKDFWDDTNSIVKDEKEKAAAKGDIIVTLTDDEIQVWKDLLLETHQPTLDEICALRGDDVAYKIYDRTLELIAEKQG